MFLPNLQMGKLRPERIQSARKERGWSWNATRPLLCPPSGGGGRPVGGSDQMCPAGGTRLLCWPSWRTFAQKGPME